MKARPKQSKPISGQQLRPTTPGDAVASPLTTVPQTRALPPRAVGSHWTFLTNHSHVLIILARNPTLVLREVALQVGITERAVQRIIADLEASGIIKREKIGRQNHYRIHGSRRLRHDVARHRTIGELLAFINQADV